MKKYNIFLIIILFSMIYSPVLFGVNLIHIAGVISWIYIFINYKNIYKLFKVNSILLIVTVIFLLWIYVFFVSIYHGNSWNQGIHFLYWIIEYLPVSMMVSIFLTKRNYNQVDLINLLLVIGIIQGITAFLAFINPNIQSFFIQQLVQYGYTETFLSLTNVRMYGLSTGLTFSTPIIQSVLAIITIFLALNKDWKYSLLTPILIFSAIINARISIVILMVGLFAIILVFKPSLRKIARTSVFMIVSIVLISNILKFIEKKMVNTFEWISSGYEEIIYFIQGDTLGYFTYVVDDNQYPLPQGLELITGAGLRIMGANRYNVSTDIGYINDIWLGGIVYMIAIYIFIIYMLLALAKSVKTSSRLNVFLALLFLLVIVLSNIKGFVIGKNDVIAVLFIFFTHNVLRRGIRSVD